jgi:hypothetical protein
MRLEPKPTDTEIEIVVLWPNGEIVELENIYRGFEVAQLMDEVIS